jgi:hypothetical protein
MTTLRTAAQQALEALEFLSLEFFMLDPISPGRESTIKAITALRAALAEPVEEPVAKVELMTAGGNAGLATRIVEIDDHLRERLRPGQMLYTAPPQRKPLSEEEIDRIDACIDKFTPLREGKRLFARAIEQAHGIGGTDE